jgi:uncharacterized membrane protein
VCLVGRLAVSVSSGLLLFVICAFFACVGLVTRREEAQKRSVDNAVAYCFDNILKLCECDLLLLIGFHYIECSF